VAPVVGE
jgi:hypothetical protein